MLNWPKQRAWGWYATLIRTPWFCLKLLRFKPNGSLSVQRHFQRTEIWLFLRGEGNGKFSCINNSNWINDFIVDKVGWWIIRPNTWHQFIAHNKPVYAIELQYGRKVTENDIERK